MNLPEKTCFAKAPHHVALSFRFATLGTPNSDYTENSLHFAFPNWLCQLRIVANVRVVLQTYLYDKNDEELKEIVKTLLQKRGIDVSDFFSYCSHSYGIERNNLTILIGGTPVRTDTKTHLRDNVKVIPFDD